MTEVLHSAGFEILPVCSGEEAVARLPALALVAFVLASATPGIDGGQLATHADHPPRYARNHIDRLCRARVVREQS